MVEVASHGGWLSDIDTDLDAPMIQKFFYIWNIVTRIPSSGN
jgi:hypothetical protein